MLNFVHCKLSTLWRNLHSHFPPYNKLVFYGSRETRKECKDCSKLYLKFSISPIKLWKCRRLCVNIIASIFLSCQSLQQIWQAPAVSSLLTQTYLLWWKLWDKKLLLYKQKVRKQISLFDTNILTSSLLSTHCIFMSDFYFVE